MAWLVLRVTEIIIAVDDRHPYPGFYSGNLFYQIHYMKAHSSMVKVHNSKKSPAETSSTTPVVDIRHRTKEHLTDNKPKPKIPLFYTGPIYRMRKHDCL
jgi:hypothetical protein